MVNIPLPFFGGRRARAGTRTSPQEPAADKQELIRLQKEVETLRVANEQLKEQLAARSIRLGEYLYKWSAGGLPLLGALGLGGPAAEWGLRYVLLRGTGLAAYGSAKDTAFSPRDEISVLSCFVAWEGLRAGRFWAFSVFDSGGSLLLDLPRVAERVLKLALPSTYAWLLGFYCLFHLWLNVLAELTRFGDREFYKDWWNAATVGEYWKLWNMPVHKWLLRHVYFPAIRAGSSRFNAILLTFFVSAVFHELLLGVPLHMVRLWAFAGIMFQVPLIMVTEMLRKKLNRDELGNYIFWIAFCVVGQPVCVLLYYHDYVVGIRPALLALRQAAAAVGGAAAAVGEAAAAAAAAGAGVAGTVAAGVGAAAAAAIGGMLGDGGTGAAAAAAGVVAAGNCTLGAVACGVS
ncbi:hypothetical protein CHLRE_01g045903v5 [Chlamydomonas reinhardtii]|uniref:diacylglycerol O-acyltransferase n=1 Tax=Chlamydomonas reinhardtii TaxID=3055 RepID=A0A2K3E7S4_CHLRE|nr:uncharacterized protein CHLRE_01g045903v5 [Chlamydomonas reinhardtii]PNW88823.1 hypothetical protein CHLRE_01g045903v5 [Chlamydomonas reinhardtii]